MSFVRSIMGIGPDILQGPWFPRTSYPLDPIESATKNVIWDGSFFQAIASPYIIRSSDGKTWSISYTGGTMSSNIFIDGNLRLTGSSGLVVRSTNGINWTPGSFALGGNTVQSITSDNAGLYVAVCGQGPSPSTRISTSTTGIDWTSRFTSTTSIGIARVVFGNDLFLVSGRTSNTYYTSSDGINWTSRLVSGSLPFFGTVFFNGLFYRWELNQGLFSSSDGINWNLVNTPFPTNVGEVEFSVVEDSLVISVYFVPIPFYAITRDAINWRLFSRSRESLSGFSTTLSTVAVSPSHCVLLEGNKTPSVYWSPR